MAKVAEREPKDASGACEEIKITYDWNSATR